MDIVLRFMQQCRLNIYSLFVISYSLERAGVARDFFLTTVPFTFIVDGPCAIPARVKITEIREDSRFIIPKLSGEDKLNGVFTTKIRIKQRVF